MRFKNIVKKDKMQRIFDLGNDMNNFSYIGTQHDNNSLEAKKIEISSHFFL